MPLSRKLQQVAATQNIQKSEIMKAKLYSLCILLGLLAGLHQVSAQGTRFFRIVGPAATKIIAFRPDGTIVWTNRLVGTNYTIQTLSSLPGGTNWVNYVQLPVTNHLNTNQLISFHPPAGMALIPAGSFTMGDVTDTNAAGDAPPTNVYVSAFYMDQNDVSEKLWQQVYNWAINNGYDFMEPGSPNDGYTKGPNYPVVDVVWFDAVKWCNARSEMAGLTPAYYTDGTQTTVYRSYYLDLTNGCVNWGSGYRLPTEAEWEKAARGGASGKRFPWGNTISESQANYYSQGPQNYAYDLSDTGFNPAYGSNPFPYTSPVGSFAPNGYGLYDMAGNVHQWCWDSYGTYAGGSNPHGPDSEASRVKRGGSWDTWADFCRSANRVSGNPVIMGSSYDIGFRSVLPAGR